jgi:hypothetical protein
MLGMSATARPSTPSDYSKIDAARLVARCNGFLPAIVRGFSPSCRKFHGIDAMGRKTLYSKTAKGWRFVETSEDGKKLSGIVSNLPNFAFWTNRKLA